MTLQTNDGKRLACLASGCGSQDLTILNGFKVKCMKCKRIYEDTRND